jgi:catechol 2,3-dioxygenase-like lactoylglutathione lyase family enzyme
VKPLASKISIETTPHERVAGPVALEPPIPVLRITSLTAAAEFYADFLGFKFDWGNDEPPAQPAYAQVSRDGVQLHLAEESEGGRSGALLFRDMKGLTALHRAASSATVRPTVCAVRPIDGHPHQGAMPFVPGTLRRPNAGGADLSEARPRILSTWVVRVLEWRDATCSFHFRCVL